MRLRGGVTGSEGELFINGHSVSRLAMEHGTPLYIYNEEFIKGQCAAVIEALQSYPGASRAYYASKAYPNAAIERLVHSQGLGVDVSSLGELCVAMMAGIPPQDIILHGAYKPDEYLARALEYGVGLIVLDSAPEIDRLADLADKAGKRADVLIRVNPGVEAETHKAVRTANLDTKFGIPLLGDMALDAVKKASARPSLNLRGVHCHVGSQVFKMDVYDVAAGILLDFIGEANGAGAQMDVLNLGGGYGCWYSRGDTPLPMFESVSTVIAAVVDHCQKRDMPLPELMIEPGRAIVAESALALYTIGAVKEVPGVNSFIVIDGGLFENPRAYLYGARYTAYLATRAADKPERYFTVSGMSCETDTIISRIKLPVPREGELLAIPSAGAYQLAMAGNYNRMPRPAALLAGIGRVAMIQRRQTIEEVLAWDVIPDDL